MDVYASLRFLRMSPRKVRLVVDAVRGLHATAAETRLQFIKKDAALPVLKLLRSAMANAQHNFHLEKDELYISKIVADGGPTLKRFRPRAFGRAAAIRKRTTHVTLVLSTKEKKTASEAKPAAAKKPTKKKAATSARPATAN